MRDCHLCFLLGFLHQPSFPSCRHEHMCTQMHKHTCAYIYMHTYKDTDTCTRTCICTRTHMCTLVRIHMCTHMNKHTQSHTHTCTYMGAYTHVQTLQKPQSLPARTLGRHWAPLHSLVAAIWVQPFPSWDDRPSCFIYDAISCYKKVNSNRYSVA